MITGVLIANVAIFGFLASFMAHGGVANRVARILFLVLTTANAVLLFRGV